MRKHRFGLMLASLGRWTRTKLNMTDFTFAKGSSFPLGASFTPEGVNFAVYSFHAEAITLCLYDPKSPETEMGRFNLQRDDADIWSGLVIGLKPGALYGFRASGPWEKKNGLLFNSNKLLLDPYTKAVQGEPNWHPLMEGMTEEGTPEMQDNGTMALKSVVIDDTFNWEGDTPLYTPWEDVVVYEAHVQGLTKTNPAVPENLRGTYAGLAHDATTSYLRDLGVTAVQLLPVHTHLDDGFLIEKGLTNYWGYNTLSFFAPHAEYAAAKGSQAQIDEFKGMVKALHRAGIEVILDVVYNHTAEGNERGPFLNLRGLDNTSYYMPSIDKDGWHYMNYTGCGNTVNAASPAALRLIMDSLRYWAEVMHVDGFRFDLAATLGRNGPDFNQECAFFQAVAQDPVLCRLKFIAEPWDLGPNGYQVGGFPKPWRELNGRYRDTVRSFWCGYKDMTAEFAKRLCGSQDIFGPALRPPVASLNFVTSHDGFTLRDLWSYNRKHNEANGEGNRDGDDNNHSWNSGKEGPTQDPLIAAMRRRLTRSTLATMFLSLGVPFLLAGDERWRTQGGNNNGYCQDNEISWLDWSADPEAESMLNFTKSLTSFRRSQSIIRKHRYFSGEINPATGQPDISWLNFEGKELDHEEWHHPETRFFVAKMEANNGPLLILFNSSDSDTEFPLPEGSWKRVFDTALEPAFADPKDPAETGLHYVSLPRTVACLMRLA